MPYRLQPAALLQAFTQYQQKCDGHTVDVRYRNEIITLKKPKIYLLEVFCCLVGIDEDELEKLRQNRNYKKVIKQIEFAVLARKLDALVNGEGSASGLIFDLKANHGLHVKKANKAAEDQHWDITMNLGNESISEAVRKTGKTESPEDRKTGKTESPEDGKTGDEEEDEFIWDSRGEGAGFEEPDAGPNNGEEVEKPAEAGEPKHVDPSVVGEPILLTKQYPKEGEERMVNVKQVNPHSGLIFYVQKPYSSLTYEEQKRADNPMWPYYIS